MLKARLHPRWTSAGYRYSVIFRGKLLVERSRDPECDAARALVAKGITGKLTMLDGRLASRAQSSTSSKPHASPLRKDLTVPAFVDSEVWREPLHG
jgi:hypothetical protein